MRPAICLLRLAASVAHAMVALILLAGCALPASPVAPVPIATGGARATIGTPAPPDKSPALQSPAAPDPAQVTPVPGTVEARSRPSATTPLTTKPPVSAVATQPVAPTKALTAAIPTTSVSGRPSATTGVIAPAGKPGLPLRAWSVAQDDGSVFVLDAGQRVWRLAPRTLDPIGASPALFPGDGGRPAFLVDAGPYLLAGSLGVTRTLVLDKQDFRQLAAWDQAGPLAADGGRRAFMAWEGGLWAHDLADPGRPPIVVTPAPRMNLGAVPVRMAVDPGTRRLYVVYHNLDASPPHQHETYRIYDLDTLKELVTLKSELGRLERPSFAGQAGRIVGLLHAMNGFLGSRLLIYEGLSVEPRPSRVPLEGVPAIDPAGTRIYLLQERGLWVLDGESLALLSVIPITTEPPTDLTLAPDGATLYLFGNGWLKAWPAEELASRGIEPVPGPFPAAWTYPASTPFMQPRLFRSPAYETDGTAFVIVGGYGETYRTRDFGRTWQFLPALSYPEFRYTQELSLSPDFATDHTLTAHPAMLRSTDGGDHWQPFEPRIAFVSDRDGVRQIYTANQDGSTVCRVTADGLPHENPAWSPAWTRLVFQTQRDGVWQLDTLRAGCDLAPGGADLRTLTSGPYDHLLPAWSPHGRQVAYVSTRDGNPDLYALAYGAAQDGTGAALRLTDDPSGDWRPAWESDGLHLVFTSGRGGSNGIYRLALPAHLAGAGPLPAATLLATGSGDNRDPAMNRDGMLAFLSNRDGVFRPFTLDTSYEGPQVYPQNSAPEAQGHPAWIDGVGMELLVTAERDGETGIYHAGYGNGLAPVVVSSAFNGQPAWGPPLWRPDPAAGRALLGQAGQ